MAERTRLYVDETTAPVLDSGKGKTKTGYLLGYPFPADFLGKDWFEPLPPEPNGFVADVEAAFMQQVLDIAKRQRKPDIHHHREADDFGRGFEVAERSSCRRGARVGW